MKLVFFSFPPQPFLCFWELFFHSQKFPELSSISDLRFRVLMMRDYTANCPSFSSFASFPCCWFFSHKKRKEFFLQLLLKYNIISNNITIKQSSTNTRKRKQSAG